MEALGATAIEIEKDLDDSFIDSLTAVELYGAYPFRFDGVLKYLKEKARSSCMTLMMRSTS